jgi:hypothetical protein
MLPLVIWDLIVGSVTMVAALLSWRRGRGEGSHARRWQSVTFIVLSLCAWFSAVALLVAPDAALVRAGGRSECAGSVYFVYRDTQHRPRRKVNRTAVEKATGPHTPQTVPTHFSKQASCNLPSAARVGSLKATGGGRREEGHDLDGVVSSH